MCFISVPLFWLCSKSEEPASPGGADLFQKLIKKLAELVWITDELRGREESYMWKEVKCGAH